MSTHDLCFRADKGQLMFTPVSPVLLFMYEAWIRMVAWFSKVVNIAVSHDSFTLETVDATCTVTPYVSLVRIRQSAVLALQLVISRFGFEDSIFVLIVPVPCYCLLISFTRGALHSGALRNVLQRFAMQWFVSKKRPAALRGIEI